MFMWSEIGMMNQLNINFLNIILQASNEECDQVSFVVVETHRSLIEQFIKD